jgi:hypothetical protein
LDSFGSLRALKVNGDLSIWYCPGLTELPDGLKVNGYLSLWNCTRLKELPDDLHVGEEIWYNSKTGFYGHMHEPGVIPGALKRKLRKNGR